MRRRTFLAALGAGCTGLAGCTDDQQQTEPPTESPTTPPQSDAVETDVTFENHHDEPWILEATFVDQPFEGAEVTLLDGSSRALDDATTTGDVYFAVDQPDRITAVSFGDAPTAILDRTVAPGDAVSETVETWTGTGFVALLHREGAHDDPDSRGFVDISCLDDAPLVESIRLTVDADGSYSLDARCGRE